MTIVLELTGERHIVTHREADPRICWTACGRRIANVGHRRHLRARRCSECFYGARSALQDVAA